MIRLRFSDAERALYTGGTELIPTDGIVKATSDKITAGAANEVDKARGTLIDDEPPPPLDPKKIRGDLGLADDDVQHFPDGYYQSQDGKVVSLIS